MGEIGLRPAVEGDAEMLYRWRNIPFLVSRSSSQRGVSLPEHLAWFRESLGGDARRIFIILKGAVPIGQIRFDRQGPDACVVSVYVLEESTGQGYGVEAIRLGSKEAFRGWGMKRIIACVREDNPPAQKAFVKSGYAAEDVPGICPAKHRSFVLRDPEGRA